MKPPGPQPPRPGRIYGIADLDALEETSLADAVEEMAEAGIRWIQIRAKGRPDADLYRLCEEVCERREGSQVELWINDRADLAALFPVAGLHLGQGDLPPPAARRVVGRGPWIGASTHNREEIEVAARDGEVDVVAVGPVFPTTSKLQPDPVVGLDLLRRARAATAKPLVAIGGIDASNVAEVLAAGADSVAVLGALCRGDIRSNARRLLRAAGEG